MRLPVNTENPPVAPSDTLHPDIDRFGLPIITVDAETLQISLTWPNDVVSPYVQMSSELFIEWVATLNAQRRLLVLLIADNPSDKTEINALKQKLTLP